MFRPACIELRMICAPWKFSSKQSGAYTFTRDAELNNEKVWILRDSMMAAFVRNPFFVFCPYS
jgi:hypothetical protein